MSSQYSWPSQDELLLNVIHENADYWKLQVLYEGMWVSSATYIYANQRETNASNSTDVAWYPFQTQGFGVVVALPWLPLRLRLRLQSLFLDIVTSPGDSDSGSETLEKHTIPFQDHVTRLVLFWISTVFSTPSRYCDIGSDILIILFVCFARNWLNLEGRTTSISRNILHIMHNAWCPM